VNPLAIAPLLRDGGPLDVPFPPTVEEFFPHSLFGPYPWFTRIALLVWLAVAIILVFFLVAYRNPKIVPTKGQWIAESIYGFARDNVAKEMIGAEGVKFAPYLTCLLSFILVTNIFSIIPGIQISPNAHIAFPVILALISYVMFNYVGIKRHGFVKYMKLAIVAPAPWYIQPILIPIEFASTFLIRPFTLAIRLFANMFAGHVILLVFSLGGFVLLGANSLAIKPISILSWALAIALTFLEAFIAILQAYVFVILTSSYVQGALAEEH
jgi:F-type H+-transporting ATPase subunit a